MLLDLARPINWRHPLSQDLRALWLAPQQAAGDDVLIDLTGAFTASAAATQWSAREDFGRFLAPNFDGANDFYTIGGPVAELQIAGSKTIVAWVKTTSTATFREVLTLAEAGGSFVGYNFGFSGNTAGRVGLYHSDTGAWREATSGATNDGYWHQIAVSIDAGVSNGSVFYLDGEAVGTATVNHCTFATSSNSIGAYPSFRWSAFSLGELRVYGRPLAAHELLAHYEETHPANPRAYCQSLNWLRRPTVYFGEIESAGDSFTAAIAGTMGAMSASLSAGFTKPTYTASIAGTQAPMTAALSASRTLPTDTANIAATHAPMTASLGANFSAPEFTASIAATNAPMSASVSATFDQPTYTASVTATLAPMTSTVSATSATEIDTASIIATLGAMTASLTAAFSNVIYVTTECGIVPYFTRSTVPRFRRRNIVASMRRNTVPKFRRARR